MTPDLTARRVIVASLLYYGMDLALVDDATYDEMANRVADQFGRLSALRKWQLGSAQAIRASGYQCKVTQAAAAAAVIWAEQHHPTGIVPYAHRQRPWRYSDTHAVHWLSVSEIRKSEAPARAVPVPQGGDGTALAQPVNPLENLEDFRRIGLEVA